MAIKLQNDPTLVEDLIKIDPYYNMQELKVIYGVCINSALKMRKEGLNLPSKEKGRPKNSGITFKDEARPEEIEKLAATIKERIDKCKERTPQTLRRKLAKLQAEALKRESEIKEEK